MSLLAAQDPSAAGAAMDQVALATGWGVFMTIGLLVLCLGHRSGKVGVLRFGDRLSRRVSGLPGWAAIPSVMALVTLLPALFGLQWDESLHLADGRDEGPLANPSHYLLLSGIFGGFAAGVIAMAMGDRSVPRSGLRITSEWTAPLGGALLAGGSAVALLGFPTDDVWHRLFGQDVTLWGPTHVAMIAGMSLAVIGAIVLNVEGLRARTPSKAPASAGERVGSLLQKALQRFQLLFIPAVPLLVLSLLQGEFDYGIPQFRLIFHPMLVLLAAGMALVAARVYLGRGAAISGVIFFLVIRGAISLILGPGLDKPVHVFPLYLAEAAIIELVALRVSTRDTLRFGVWCGALIGTVGLAAEWAWSNVFPIPWNSALFPEVLILGPGMALAGAVLGAWMGAHLHIAGRPRSIALRNGAIASCLAVAGMIGYGLVEPAGSPVRATVTLDDVRSAPERTVHATVRLDPPDAAKGSEWLRTIAWQGGGLVSEPLREVSPGVYRTREPVPVHGAWKSAIRLQRGGSIDAMPLYLPADTAIPAPEVAAPARFTRDFADEAKFLQREAKDVPGWAWTTGVVTVALLMTALLGIWALALRRLAIAAPRNAPLGTEAAASPAPPKSPPIVGPRVGVPA